MPPGRHGTPLKVMGIPTRGLEKRSWACRLSTHSETTVGAFGRHDTIVFSLSFSLTVSDSRGVQANWPPPKSIKKLFSDLVSHGVRGSLCKFGWHAPNGQYYCKTCWDHWHTLPASVPVHQRSRDNDSWIQHYGCECLCLVGCIMKAVVGGTL